MCAVCLILVRGTKKPMFLMCHVIMFADLLELEVCVSWIESGRLDVSLGNSEFFGFWFLER